MNDDKIPQTDRPSSITPDVTSIPASNVPQQPIEPMPAAPNNSSKSLHAIQFIMTTLFLLMWAGVFLWNHFLPSHLSSIIVIPALYISIPVLPSIVILSIVSAMKQPHNKTTNKPSIIHTTFSILIALAGASYIFYFVYQIVVVVPRDDARRSAERDVISQKSRAQQERLQAQAEEVSKPDATSVEITETEASKLLQTCQIQIFVNSAESNTDTNKWGELKGARVVLTKSEGKPVRLNVASINTYKLDIAAQEAKKTCPDLHLWQNGKSDQPEPTIY